jgi:hypothetical protein
MAINLVRLGTTDSFNCEENSNYLWWHSTFYRSATPHRYGKFTASMDEVGDGSGDSVTEYQTGMAVSYDPENDVVVPLQDSNKENFIGFVLGGDDTDSATNYTRPMLIQKVDTSTETKTVRVVTSADVNRTKIGISDDINTNEFLNLIAFNRFEFSKLTKGANER